MPRRAMSLATTDHRQQGPPLMRWGWRSGQTRDCLGFLIETRSGCPAKAIRGGFPAAALQAPDACARESTKDANPS